MRSWNTSLAAAAAAALVLSGTTPAAAQAAPAQSAAPSAQAATAQTPVHIPPLAEEHLRAAIDALNGIDASTLKGEAATRIAAVKDDFQRMRTALSRPGSGTNGDWKAAYSAVERDLTPIIGPINANAGTGVSQGMAGIDSVTAGGLELFRSSLELFYEAMMREPAPGLSTGTNAPGTATAPATATSAVPASSSAPVAGAPTGTAAAAAPGGQPTSACDASGAGALLDRIHSVISSALGMEPAKGMPEAVGTSGTTAPKQNADRKSSAGRVSVDRAALDEVLAEVQQLEIMLRVRR